MATLIPAIGTCVSNMTGGERRLAYRLEQKLEDDWLLWYDVPLGPRNMHPDFVVFNPRRGLLVLEVKDWKLARHHPRHRPPEKIEPGPFCYFEEPNEQLPD